MSLHDEILEDMWAWIGSFVTVPNEFYNNKFAPCPYAKGAVKANTVDVVVWKSGDVRSFIRDQAVEMRDSPRLTTRAMTFPPRTQWAWGISEFVEELNAEMIPDNVFLNTGVAKTTTSRYPGSAGKPYFIVVANSLDGVLKGAAALERTKYYVNWPQSHFEIVVERRARMAKRFGNFGK